MEVYNKNKPMDLDTQKELAWKWHCNDTGRTYIPEDSGRVGTGHFSCTQELLRALYDLGYQIVKV